MAEHAAPPDAEARRAVAPVMVYPPDTLSAVDLTALRAARTDWTRTKRLRIEPRTATAFALPEGHFFRILSVEGPQVGDLNLWAADDLSERFYSGKTRALHGTHLTTGDRLWSNLPHLRPMATITEDSLDWYGRDAFGCGIHDVIGTRCDPFTHRMLAGADYDRCCHSNLTRALAERTGRPRVEVEPLVHDVLNVFMCTGFDRETGRYVMKTSPVRPGDFIEFFAEIELLAALSACPGGDCGSEHSSDAARCHPLEVEIYRPARSPAGWSTPARNAYAGGHGA